MRCGLEKEDRPFIMKFTQQLEDAGADWISIHARLQSQKHKGYVNWELLEISELLEKSRCR